MKSTYIILLLFISMNVFSQVTDIKATKDKTTSILFPATIIHVDLGVDSPFIGVQLDPNVPNLLKIRISPDFSIPTNMLVVTEDENVYSFNVAYSDSLNQYVHIIKKENAVNAVKQDKNETQTDVPANQEVRKDSLTTSEVLNKILQHPNGLLRTEIAKKGKMTLSMKNLFVHNDDLYLQLEITNRSNIKYTIDFYNFFMKSKMKKALKGTTSQDIQINYDFLHKEVKEVLAGQIETVIIHVKKFTLEDDKIACLEVYEEGGGRHLKINITNNELLEACEL